ncbi:hypothetical protein BH09ACT8_BH09ACT8_09050 [soil metagenome]
MWHIELNIAGHQFVHRAPDHAVEGRRIVGMAAHRLAGVPAQVREQVRHLRAA